MTNKMDKTTTILILTACALVYRISSAADVTCAKKFEIIAGHTACLSTSPDATSQPVTDQEKQDILNKHNTLRSGVTPAATNMMKMTWDDELEMIAQKWADTCPGISHDKGQHRYVPGRFGVGQNMGSGYDSFDVLIQAWYDEVIDYTFGQKKSDHTGTIGHYTQVVWAESSKLGCGRATCSGTTSYVCNYGPAGNVGDFTGPYTSGTKGADCETNDNGLCDCGGLVCLNNKDMDTSACTCSCGTYVTPDCSLNCDLDDVSYCGTGSFTESNCITSLAAFVSSDCPKMCGLCPYAAKGYVEPADAVTTAEVTTKAAPTDSVTTKAAPTDAVTTKVVTTDVVTTGNVTIGNVTIGNVTTNVDNDDDDDAGASTCQLCVSLFILSILVAHLTTL